MISRALAGPFLATFLATTGKFRGPLSSLCCDRPLPLLVRCNVVVSNVATMSFLDVVKRSIVVDREEELPSVKPQPKQKALTKVKAPSTKIPQQTADASSRSSRENASMAQRRPISNSRSLFSQLSCEIVQFQKIVSELQLLVDRSGDTPEAQWRSRIVLQSAEEADADIGKKIRYQELTAQNVKDASVRASYQKLKRDYKRAHDSFKTASRLYTKRQQEAIARLEGEHGFASPEQIQKKALAQQEVRSCCIWRRLFSVDINTAHGDTVVPLPTRQEEFFYRAMREREAEIQNINTSMHKVNNIYQVSFCEDIC